MYVSASLTRYITRDELKHAMSRYGMGDDATIDEVLDDVDTDKVSGDLASVLLDCLFVAGMHILF